MATTIPIVILPGTTATHVLGSDAVELDTGDLTLSRPTTDAGAQGRTPVLTLSVGKAAFPLYYTTAVGTVAGDERVYVFRPELGDDIKGYIRITLPDGIREHGSEFQAIQATFERVLIDHGLLSAAEGPNERKVTIPWVTATHELGEASVVLAEGDLTLSTINPNEDKPKDDTAAVLMLRVGKALFALHRTTLFGTLAQNDRTYAFKPEMAATGGEGFVKIVLPEAIASDKELEALQEVFEQILVDYGLLKAGIEAVGDELGRSVSEDATRAAEAIRRSKTDWLAENPSTTSPMTFSPTAHKVTAKGAAATESLFGAASSVRAAFASVASTAGAWISSAVGPASPSTAESLDSLANAYDAAAQGVGAGAVELKNVASETLGEVTQNEFGRNARTVGGNIGQGVGNVTGAVGQVAEVGAVAAASSVRGAIDEDRKMQEERGTFTIQEQEESGEFKDIPV